MAHLRLSQSANYNPIMTSSNINLRHYCESQRKILSNNAIFSAPSQANHDTKVPSSGPPAEADLRLLKQGKMLSGQP